MVKLGIVGNSTRNDDICDIALQEFEEGNRVLICNTEEIHGHILQDLLSKKWLAKKQYEISHFNETKVLEIIEDLELEDSINLDNTLEDIRNQALVALEKDFNPEYIFGRENREKKKEMIAEASYGSAPCIVIGTNAVGIGTDTRNINVVLLADVRKSSIRVLQSIGRGGRIKTYINELNNNVFKVYNWEDWFHPKLMEHSYKREKVYKKYFLGQDSVTEDKWKKL